MSSYVHYKFTPQPLASQPLPRWLQEIKPIDENMIFEHAAVEWLRAEGSRMGPKKIGDREVTPVTYKDYARKLRAAALFFGPLKLSDITVRH